MHTLLLKVQCPTCLQQVEWSEEHVFRPFCSEKCRLIDLGDWLDEQRSMLGNKEIVSKDTLE